MSSELLSMLRMRPSKSLRHQDLNELSDQFVAVVTEQALRRCVYEYDAALRVCDDYCVRIRLEQASIPSPRLLALTEIMAELGKPPQFAGPVAQSRKSDIRQESRSTFPHAYAFFFVPAVYDRPPKNLLRPAPLDIFRRKKAGKIVSDNLFGCITLETHGSGIPTDNVSPQVQEEDGVVLNPIEEHLKLPFAISEVLLG